MFEQVLDRFPAHTHPLVLVSDPDDLLADEAILAQLIERGFQIVQETDPVLFRHRVEQLKPFSVEKPVLALTEGALEDVPYDLWQQGRHIRLALHDFFPNLVTSYVRALTSLQRTRLNRIAQPKERLGEQRTIQFLLEHVFGFSTKTIQQPAYFILWLDEFHQTLAPFPPVILEQVLAVLSQFAEYRAWPLKGMLQDRAAFQQFIQDQWHGFLAFQTGTAIGEEKTEYLLHFENNQRLQDALPRLVRSGNLAPVQVETRAPLPDWVVPGILLLTEDPRPRRMAELNDLLRDELAQLKIEARWEAWQTLATHWAELTILRNEVGTSLLEDDDPYLKIQTQIDRAFVNWLDQRYALLAAKMLPVPHHVYHVPHYLNYLRSQPQSKVQKIALLVMDGMSVTDWLLLKQAWQMRQTAWQFQEKFVLAQIPTITAISRLALVSGQRPVVSTSNAAKLTEKKAWSAFWMRKEVSVNAIAYLPLNLEKEDPLPEITNPRLEALCLIERQLDDIMHGSTLGAMDHQETVNLWLSSNDPRTNSSKLENVINVLLDERFTVFLASDHGHCEAVGFGTLSEGVVAYSRGQRARLYTDRRAAEKAHMSYNDTVVWTEDGLLPNDVYAIMPSGRQAFAEFSTIIITHGGTTLDEVIVPLIEITK